MPIDPSSTGGSTDNGLTGLVTSPTSTLPIQPASAVTPAQTVPSSQQHQQQPTMVQPADVSTLIAQYEGRIRNLMSEKDKAINERNSSISQLTTLQREYDEFKAMNSASLQASVENTQRAIDDKKSLERRIADLEGEAIRAKTLLEKPHLAPYAQFIPANGDPEKVRVAVEQLEAIRTADLQRNGLLGSQHTGQTQAITQQSSSQGQPTQQQGQVSQQFAQLYAGRQNLPSSLVAAMPGSAPAQMNPGALTDPNVEIARIFEQARASGSPADFDRALQQAQVLANAAINQQLGRTTTTPS